MAQETTFADIAIGAITVPDNRARDYDVDWGGALAALIDAQGLLNPITVRQVGAEHFELVAGLHRLRAHEVLGRSMIAARISTDLDDDAARLMELMENLGRHELIALDRCHHLFELKRVWERLHPEFANGGGQTLPTGSDKVQIFGFASEVAEKIGLAKRTINLAVNIWKGLTPASRNALHGSKTASNQSEIKLLSEQTPARQARVIEMLTAEPPLASGVADALILIDSGVRPDVHERKFAAATQMFETLDEALLDRVLQANADRVIEALKRLGRI